MKKWFFCFYILLFTNPYLFSESGNSSYTPSNFKLSKTIREVSFRQNEKIRIPSQLDISESISSNYYVPRGGKSILQILRSSKNFVRVDFSDTKNIKNLLNKGNPIIVGILVFENFQAIKDEVYASGSGKFQGGEVLVIVGYDDAKNAFKVKQTWKEDSIRYIDYKWFQNVCREAWLIKNENSQLTNTKYIPPEDIYVTNGIYKNKIRISWNRVNGAIGYIIYRKIQSDAGFLQVGLSTDTKFDDTGIHPNQTYLYSVVSVYEDGKKSDFSSSFSGYSGLNNEDKVGRVVGLQASKEHFQKIRLSWQELDDTCSYKILKWNNSSKTFQFIKETKELNYSDLKVNKKGLVEFYRVRPVCSGKVGIDSYSVMGRVQKSSKINVNAKVSGTNFKRPKKPKVQLFQKDDSFNVRLDWKVVPQSKEYKIWEKEFGDKNWKLKQIVSNPNKNWVNFELPSLDKFYLYSLTYHVNREDSEFSEAVAVAKSLPVQSKMPRSFGVTSQLDKFKGVWVGMQWMGGFNVKNIVLKIDSEGGSDSNFVLIVNQKKTYKGRYINDARSLKVGKKIRVELSNNEDTLMVQLNDNSVVKAPSQLPFVRE